MFSPTTITGMREKCKSLLGRIPRDILIIAILILACLFSFGLGYLAGLDAGQASGISLTISPLVATVTNGQVLAAKTGTKYYLPWCAGADRISDANKVRFASASAAQAVGYTPATNCNGI